MDGPALWADNDTTISRDCNDEITRRMPYRFDSYSEVIVDMVSDPVLDYDDQKGATD